MWSKWSHLIHTLTALTSHKVKFKLTYVEQKEFDDIKHAVSQENLLAYPDLNERFDIHTDARKYQLGAVMI